MMKEAIPRHPNSIGSTIAHTFDHPLMQTRGQPDSLKVALIAIRRKVTASCRRAPGYTDNLNVASNPRVAAPPRTAAIPAPEGCVSR